MKLLLLCLCGVAHAFDVTIWQLLKRAGASSYYLSSLKATYFEVTQALMYNPASLKPALHFIDQLEGSLRERISEPAKLCQDSVRCLQLIEQLQRAPWGALAASAVSGRPSFCFFDRAELEQLLANDVVSKVFYLRLVRFTVPHGVHAHKYDEPLAAVQTLADIFTALRNSVRLLAEFCKENGGVAVLLQSVLDGPFRVDAFRRSTLEPLARHVAMQQTAWVLTTLPNGHNGSERRPAYLESLRWTDAALQKVLPGCPPIVDDPDATIPADTVARLLGWLEQAELQGRARSSTRGRIKSAPEDRVVQLTWLLDMWRVMLLRVENGQDMIKGWHSLCRAIKALQGPLLI